MSFSVFYKDFCSYTSNCIWNFGSVRSRGSSKDVLVSFFGRTYFSFLRDMIKRHFQVKSQLVLHKYGLYRGEKWGQNYRFYTIGPEMHPSFLRAMRVLSYTLVCSNRTIISYDLDNYNPYTSRFFLYVIRILAPIPLIS